MSAIVRQSISKELSKQFLDDILGQENNYYIGIGKSDVFNIEDTVIDPIDSLLEEREFRHNLQSIKSVEGATYVTRRYNWNSGTKYKGWTDSSDLQQDRFYVLNSAKEVYICLEQGMSQTGEVNVSTVEPNYALHAPRDVDNHVMHWEPFTTGDGYTWKFLYSLTPETIFQFLSSNYIPVHIPESDLATGDAIEDLQFVVKQNAVSGQVLRCEIIDKGYGYSEAPIVTIKGDGTGATAIAYVTNGHLTKIEMTSYGSGYTHATVEITGDGVNAAVRPIVSPIQGIGFDAVSDLKTSSILLTIKPDGEEDGTFIVENEFRQIGLIKNPLTPEGVKTTETSLKVLPKMTLVDSSPFSSGKHIVGSQSGAIAFVDESYDNIVHFHQNESTGFVDFIQGEVITQTGVVLTGTVSEVTRTQSIDRFTGDVLYIENRHRIRRDAEQQEDIKVVITI